MKFIAVNFIFLVVCLHEVLSTIKNDRVEFDLLNADTLGTEDHLKQAMKPVNDAVGEMNAASNIFGALTHIPVIGEGFGVISKYLTYVATNNWKEGIYKYISEEIDRSSALNHLHEMQAKLQTINQYFQQLKKEKNEEDIKNRIILMRDKLMDISNLIANPQVTFRKFPQFLIPIYGSMTIIFQLFEPLHRKVFPQTPTAQMACRLQDLIEDYRELNVFYRLKSLEYFSICSAGSRWKHLYM